MTDYEVIKAMLKKNGIGFNEKTTGPGYKYIECEAGHHNGVLGYGGAKTIFNFHGDDSLWQIEAQDS